MADHGCNEDSHPECGVATPRIMICREGLDMVQFEATYPPIPKPHGLKAKVSSFLPEPVMTAVRPPSSCSQWLDFLLVHLPILQWLWTYKSSFLIGDIFSGVTVAVVHIPQGLAYALLVGLDPVYGLYASFSSVIVYSILGTSRHVSFGTFAVTSLMTGNAVVNVLKSDVSLSHCLTESSTASNMNGTSMLGSGFEDTNVHGSMNGTGVDCTAVKVDIVMSLSLLSGVFMLLMGLLQFGFITVFLSEVLVSGYTTGAAFHVLTSQLSNILGIDNIVESGQLQLPKTWLKALKRVDETNPATVIISFLAIAALIALVIVDKLLKRLTLPIWYYSWEKHKWQKTKVKWSIAIPSQLLVVILFATVSYVGSLGEKYDVNLVGHIRAGAPPVSVPSGDYFLVVIKDSFIIAIVTYTLSVSLAQIFAKKFNYEVHSNQEFIACGAANIVGSFFSSFPSAANISRSLVQVDSGGHTQLVGFVSSGVVLIVLLWLGFLFGPVPMYAVQWWCNILTTPISAIVETCLDGVAVLAAIVWVALYGMFAQVTDAWKYYKISWIDTMIWGVVFVATVVLGVDLGLGVGVFFSLLTLNIRTLLPYSAVLGMAKGTEIFKNKDYFQLESTPGVVVFRFMAPLCFLNSMVFRKRLEIACGLKKRRSPAPDNQGCLHQLAMKLPLSLKDSTPNEIHEFWPNQHNDTSGQIKTSIKRSASFMIALQKDVVGSVDSDLFPDLIPIIHTVIIDCSSIVFLDSVGMQILSQTVLEFDRDYNIQVLLAAISKEAEDVLERGQFNDVYGKHRLFPSVQDAVLHAQCGLRLHPLVNASSSSVSEQDIDTHHP